MVGTPDDLTPTAMLDAGRPFRSRWQVAFAGARTPTVFQTSTGDRATARPIPSCSGFAISAECAFPNLCTAAQQAAGILRIMSRTG